MQPRAISLGILFSGLALLAAPAAAYAQGWIEPVRPIPVVGVERLRSDVRVTVDGQRRVAHVVVEEEFRNRSRALLEGDYLYPIPPEAVFTDFSLFIGEEEIRGEMLPAEKARAIYEEIVRRRKDPALIELVGHGVLRARVFPIEPGQTRRVILRYTQILGRDGDLLRLRYPRIVGIVPGTERVEATRRPRPQGAPPFTIRIKATDAEMFGTPYSPTHTIEVRRSGRGEIEITHEGRGAARDFELFLPLREGPVGASVVTHAPGGEPGFFLLLVSPALDADRIEIPRDVTLVLDVSGSMSGDKIEQARGALEQILGGLGGEDRFRLITFSSVVRAFRSEFAPATSANLRAAREYLASVRAEGSTNLHEALQGALRPDAREGRLSVVVFLTDGKPTVGETSPERIAEEVERLRDAERVFSFGIGYDVNTYLLDRLAERGRGSVSYVRPGDDLEVAVASLTQKIRHPALSDLRIVRAPAELEDLYPNPLPDLFYGQELVILGRYRGHGRGTLVLEGRRAGRTERLEYRVSFSERETGNDFVPRLWASRKVGALTAHVRLHGPDREVVDEIRQLGLRYGILTEYTSYLVEEPLAVTAGRRPEEAALERARAMYQAPAAQSGEAAVRRADASRKLGAAVALDEIVVTGSAAAPTRHVSDRLFVLRDSTWTDIRFERSLEVVEVEAFSPAYFELVRRLPALAPYFALGDRVLVAGDGLALKVGPGGRTEWRASDLRRVVRAFANPAGG